MPNVSHSSRSERADPGGSSRPTLAIGFETVHSLAAILRKLSSEAAKVVEHRLIWILSVLDCKNHQADDKLSVIAKNCAGYFLRL